MINSVVVLGRRDVELQKADIVDNALLISITGSDDEVLDIKNSDKVLRLVFDDIHPFTATTLQSCKDCKVFNITQALSIIKFLNVFRNDDEQHTLVVHCAAGICRSGAVGQFAQVFFSNMTNSDFNKVNPKILPNTWVRDLLCFTLFNLWCGA